MPMANTKVGRATSIPPFKNTRSFYQKKALYRIKGTQAMGEVFLTAKAIIKQKLKVTIC